jgi:D-alanine-D-alanine ligase-like ATP-grasp enzyme
MQGSFIRMASVSRNTFVNFDFLKIRQLVIAPHPPAKVTPPSQLIYTSMCRRSKKPFAPRSVAVAITSAMSEKGATFARELHAYGAQVHGIDQGKPPKWLLPRSLHSYCSFNSDSSEELRLTELLRWLVQIRPQVYLPLDSPNVRRTIAIQNNLPVPINTLLPPSEAFLEAYNKESCLQACRKLAIPTPLTLTIQEAEDRIRCGEGSVVIKPKSDQGSAIGVCFANSPQELSLGIERCQKIDPDFIIQEFIPGEMESLCSLTVLFDKQTRLIAASTMKKRITWPIQGGLNAIGISSYQPELLALMLPLFKNWRWVGGAEVEFRIDKRDGIPKVFEINPRFPGMTMFQSFSGINYPQLAFRAALEQELLPEIKELSAYRVGLTNINPGRALLATRAIAGSQGYCKTLRTMRQLTKGGAPFLFHQALYSKDILRRITLGR